MDLSVRIGDKSLPNPVGVASGTFGYGSEYEELIDLNRIGALYTKAVTKAPRPGNDVPRIIETPSGMLNSIGLANVGMERFVTEKMPFLQSLSCSVIANIAGDTLQDYCDVVEYLEVYDPEGVIWGYEINVSCPNVKTGGLSIGTDPHLVEALASNLRNVTRRPFIVKLSPNVTDVSAVARAAEGGGADAVSCVNTFVGMVVDTQRQKTVLPGGTGGLSGPAIRPLGVAITYKVARSVRIPVIGLGGIFSADHAIQYLLAGAAAVQIGTANFVDPSTATKVIDGIVGYMRDHGYELISDFHGHL